MIEQMIEEMQNLRIDKSNYFGALNITVEKYDRANEMLDSCIEIAEKYKAYKCKWTLIDEESNVYDTDCRNPHILMNGTPTDNEYKYCPYCGKEIEIDD